MTRPASSATYTLHNPQLRYWAPASNKQTLATTYELKRGAKEAQTFRRKKISACHELNYSSSLNPFGRAKFVRLDRPFKQGEKKKQVPLQARHCTDPLTLRYEAPAKTERVRPQFECSLISKQMAERRDYLPADRQFSESKMRYKLQLGLSQSLEKLPRQRETLKSERMREILAYAEADHAIPMVTSKVGQLSTWQKNTT